RRSGGPIPGAERILVGQFRYWWPFSGFRFWSHEHGWAVWWSRDSKLDAIRSGAFWMEYVILGCRRTLLFECGCLADGGPRRRIDGPRQNTIAIASNFRSEEHTSELQSPDHLVCRLLLE